MHEPGVSTEQLFLLPRTLCLLPSGWSSGLNDGDLMAIIHQPRGWGTVWVFLTKGHSFGGWDRSGSPAYSSVSEGCQHSFFFLHPTSAFIAEVFMNSVHEFMNRYGVSASLPFLPRKQHVKTWDILFHHSPAPSSGIPSAYRIKCWPN